MQSSASVFCGPRRRAVVRVLDEAPQLAAGLDPVSRRTATTRCVALKLTLPEGPWSAPQDPDRLAGWFGLLVIDGLLARTVEVEGLRAQEVLGPGDLLRPWDDDGTAASVPALAAWRVCETATLAVLDARFAMNAAPWPSIAGALLRSAVLRGSSRSVLLAIAQARRAEDRLRLLFWHLADRWGRVGPDGVTVPLRLTHERIAELVCLRRPTVSMTLGRLKAEGQIVRRPDGSWLLREAPQPAGLAA